jgi:hypothetical protein
MHIVDGVRGETPPWVFDADDECPSAGSDPAGDSTPAPSLSEPNAPRHPIATTIAWVVAHLIEGFATYGAAIYPSFIDHGGFTDDPAEPGLGTSSASRDLAPERRAMAERKLSTDGREPLAVGRAANRSVRSACNERDHCCQVLVEVASHAEDKVDHHPIGGARRSHPEGHRHQSMPNRRHCAAS